MVWVSVYSARKGFEKGKIMADPKIPDEEWKPGDESDVGGDGTTNGEVVENPETGNRE